MRFPWTSAIILLFCFSDSHGAIRPDNRPLPLFMEKNIGQYRSDADFVLRTPGMLVEFHPGEVVYRRPDHAGKQLRIRYDGGNPVRAEGVDELTGKLNYLLGDDRSSWTKDVPSFSAVAYREEWPGIDAVYSVREERLKSEFQLAPGSDPNLVRWHVIGSESITCSRDGALVIATADGGLREEPPQVFEQDRATGKLRPVAGSFRLFPGNSVGIQVGPYDRRDRLIFDPVIGFSTYFGGTGQSEATSVAVDSTGNTVIAGYTTSLDLAPGAQTFGAPQRTAAFVAKFTASGNQLIFCTYLGGSMDNRAYALALDRWNDVFVVGSTTSANFPLEKAVHGRLAGSQDAFASELDSRGNTLVFSTYLGGSSDDAAYGVALSRQGEIYIAGDTLSTDFPLVRPFQVAKAGGQDAFLVKLGVSGASVVWSSYLGGSLDEHVGGIAVAPSGNATVTGSTWSNDFPVVQAFQPQTGGNQDAFVTSVNSAGTAILFSTYAGGSGGTPGLVEGGAAVATDTSGALYVAGTTASLDFPVTPGAFQTVSPGGILDAFALKLSASGALIYSTLLGGSSVDYGCGIAVDIAGNAHIAGYTGSTDFPNLRGLQPGLMGSYDAFVTKLNSTGSALIYSTLLGGTLSDSAASIAVDRYGTAVIAGQSLSADLPVVSAYQSSLRGMGSAFVARLPIGWTPVLFSSSGIWSLDYLRNGGSNGLTRAVETITSFGDPGDVPITGDWSGSGVQKIGVFRSGTWFLDVNGNGVYDAGDRTFVFGQAGDIPVVGDWNGSGTLKAGLFRKGAFILDLSGLLSGIPTGQGSVTFPFGLPNDVPVTGDWNSSGTSKVGVFRAGEWFVDWSGSHSVNGPVWSFGKAGDLPVTGDWDGSGTTKIGVYRSGSFLLDYNGSGIWEPYGDMTLPFGPAAPYARML